MSDTIETYEARAKRLKLDPTKVCIACGSNEVEWLQLGSHKFCDRHVDWENAAVIRCMACAFDVRLVCGQKKAA